MTLQDTFLMLDIESVSCLNLVINTLFYCCKHFNIIQNHYENSGRERERQSFINNNRGEEWQLTQVFLSLTKYLK